MNPYQQDTDYKRIFLAIGLAAVVIFVWQFYIQAPRRQELERYHAAQLQKQAEQKTRETAAYAQAEAKQDLADNPALSRKDRLALSGRVAVRSGTLHGSISLTGARFDDLTLAKYHEALDPASPEVILFSPRGEANVYFAQAGWVSTDGGVKVPDQRSIWQADRTVLGTGETVNLRWDNGQGVIFHLAISLDEQYMFTIRQRVENKTGSAIGIHPYAYINRRHEDLSGSAQNAILHDGPLGVLGGALEEIGYKDLREKGNRVFEQASGWLGMTDKYWAAALIPGKDGFKATFSHYASGEKNRYQADYLGAEESVAPGGIAESSVRLFAGAKEIHVLDAYAAGDAKKQLAPIPLFDRLVDLGTLYFLTKPMFLLLSLFYGWSGNFGIAILLLTIVVKVIMYPLANKSYHAMAAMRELQPEMTKIRGRYADDQIAMQKEMMALYKREKVNPASGCLPVLVQIPVFFALYKVLFVTIEMRHAPFFWWIKDLSAIDTSNIFTAFGLIPWSHPAWLHLGVLPILFCATMVYQMRQQPAPPDPVQAKMMKFMPYFFLFLFASFPAGLVLYWTWSNVLSIFQQGLIIKQHKKKEAKKKAAA